MGLVDWIPYSGEGGPGIDVPNMPDGLTSRSHDCVKGDEIKVMQFLGQYLSGPSLSCIFSRSSGSELGV